MSLRARIAVVLACCGVVACAVALGLRWVDSAAVPVVVVQSALPLFGIVAGGCALLLLALRRWRLGGVALVVLLAFVVVGAPALRSGGVAPQDDDLVVFSANLRYGEADPAAVVSAARARDADVVVLVEVTPEALEAVEAAGLGHDWPNQTGIPLPGAAGLVVRSDLHIDPVDWGPDYPQPWAGATGRITLENGRTVVVRGSHPNAPNLRDAGPWRAALADYDHWARTRHLDEPVVMAGDFNAGFGHPAFRQLASGFTDAHRAAGRGWVRTWPVGGRVPPFTQLDHVLVRGVDVVDAGTDDLPGTDHRAVWARLHVR